MLNYTYYNEKKDTTVVFIHGFGVGCNVFESQIESFKNEFNILFIDLHGHGNSRNFQLHKQKNQSLEYVAIEINKVLEFLNINKAHFLGLSLGTIVITAFTKLYPEKVQSKILLGNATMYPKICKYVLPIGWKLRRILSYIWMYCIAALIIVPSLNHIIILRFFIEEVTKLGRNEFFAWYKLLIDFPSIYTIDDIISSKPKLYIMGEYDEIFISGTRKLVQADPMAKLEVIRKATHVVNLDNPELINNMVISFIKNID